MELFYCLEGAKTQSYFQSILFFGRAGGIRAAGTVKDTQRRRRAMRCNLLLVPHKRISAAIPHAVKLTTASHLKIIASLILILCTNFSFAQQIPDSTKTQKLDEVLVSAIRANTKMPVTFTNVSKQEIEKRNLGQDIPLLLNYLPSVVTTSDAGNGVGYTGIRVRGSDATRVNITLNGIPYNDSESHNTFWVDLPDFASSVESLQLQRGVGASTNGAGAFGASLNLLTDSYSEKANGEISNSFGSFKTRKHTVKFSTGLLNDHFEIAGRLSNIASDGYIDRAFSRLKSYFLQGTYVWKSTLIKALTFGGTERTYQSWYGIEDPERLRNNRTFNPAGQYTDEAGNLQFYDNQTDNYQQDHYQLHWNQRLGSQWNSNLALHYTKGKGYYENYNDDVAASDFPGVNATSLIDDVPSTDLIDQKWLDNDFYGAIGSVNYHRGNFNMILGGGWNKYEGEHFGKVIWARSFVGQLGDRYYDDDAIKTDGNAFIKATIDLTKKLSLYADMQYRNVNYKANAVETGIVDDSFSFFNPKGGITFTINRKNNIYLSYARANREPNRDDYENGSPKPEQLDDFEFGWRFGSAGTKININGYFMKYKNQLVLTGALNDVGAPVRENIGDSYRAGVEIDASIKVSDKIYVKPNIALSRNRNNEFYFSRDGVLQNLGDTHIAFSPAIVAGNQIVFLPLKGFQITLLSKYVGDQFMSNIDSDISKLKAYAVSDFNLSYEIPVRKIFRSITISGLLNNIFNYKYESNGYFYTYDYDPGNGSTVTGEGAGYYPQAKINFLAGLTLKF